MTERLIGETGSRKRRRFLLLPIVLVAFIALFVIAGAQAVHDEDFQLDGNVLAASTTTVRRQYADDRLGQPVRRGRRHDCAAAGWLQRREPRPDFQTSAAGAFVTNDQTTFATGSKDTLPISGWQCNFDNNVNSKIDVMNAYAATYDGPDRGRDPLLRDRAERQHRHRERRLLVPPGCRSVARRPAARSPSPEPIRTATCWSSPSSRAAAPSARSTSTAGIGLTRRRDRGSLQPDPDRHRRRLPGHHRRPRTTRPAVRRTRRAITTPWLTASQDHGRPHLATALFFEAGLNLTDSGLGGKCFSTFLGDTRSSTSLTATLFDFSGGTLGSCESGVVTTPSAGSDGSVSIGANGSVQVTDSAVLTVSGPPRTAGR